MSISVSQEQTVIVITGNTTESLASIGHYLAIRFDCNFIELSTHRNSLTTEDFAESLQTTICTILPEQYDELQYSLPEGKVLQYFLLGSSRVSKEIQNTMNVILLEGDTIEKQIDHVMKALESDGFKKFDYELWFRDDNEKALEERTLTTIIRPGIRLKSHPKGTFVGQMACARILEKPGTHHHLPRFKPFRAIVEMESIHVKLISELYSQDLKDLPENINTRDKICKHLKEIYQREFGLEEWISIITFSYKN